MFVDVFNELLSENYLNRKQFAEKSGIPYPTVIGWTNLGRLPDYYALIKIADFFNCSVDYLMERQNDYGRAAKTIEDIESERKLLSDYRLLSPENKQLIDQLIQKLK